MIRRQATEADLPRLEEIIRKSPEAGQWLPDPAETWVVEEERILGFVVIRAASADEAEVLNLAVEPEARRRGVASRLFEDIHFENLYLEVRESNAAAIRFYNKLGFYRQGTRRRYYSQPTEDAVLLGRTGSLRNTGSSVL